MTRKNVIITILFICLVCMLACAYRMIAKDKTDNDVENRVIVCDSEGIVFIEGKE